MDGGAIYNTTTYPNTVTYSTFSGNSTTDTPFSGALYNNSGSVLTVQNSTFAGNTNGGLYSSGSTLSVTNSIFGETGECVGGDCPTSGFGNAYLTTNVTLSALGNYGGTTNTILPQPGSTAICGGLHADIPSGFTTDQRGFSNAAPAGYGVANCSDSGSVQTDYTAVAFATPDGPYAGAATVAGTVPPVIVTVTENGQNAGGVTVPLVFAGTGTATGTSAVTVGGTGATFSALTVSAAGTDTLNVSMRWSAPTL